jgi:class 3 adenylate cyclase
MTEGADEKLKTTRRGLRAVFVADITGLSAAMAANETGAISAFNEMRAIVTRQLQAHEGQLFTMPGGGVFALFESAVNAVRCALETQLLLALRAAEVKNLRLRIGIHLGEVLFETDLPYGEALTIAARLEELADPGGVLVSAAVMDAVSARIPATYEERGVPTLKNIPRRIVTFAVTPPPERNDADEKQVGTSILDHTTQFDRETLRQIRDQQFSEQREGRTAQNASGAINVDKRYTPEPVQGNVMPASPGTPPPHVDPAGAPTPANRAAAKTGPAPAAAQRPDDTSVRGGQEPPPQPSARQPSPTPIIAPESAVTVPEAEAKSGLLAEPAGYRPSEECIESLIAALAVHLGPFAKVLVNRMLKNASSAEQLVVLLEEQIQSKEERALFRIRALHICMTFANRQSDES